jgi:hypothetical protein
MSTQHRDITPFEDDTGVPDTVTEVPRAAALIKTGALQNAISTANRLSSTASG